MKIGRRLNEYSLSHVVTAWVYVSLLSIVKSVMKINK